MTEREKIVLQTVVEDGTKPGFDATKRGAADMANDVRASAEKAFQALKGIGDGGELAAEKTDRTTRSISNSIKRLAAEAEAGGKANARFLEIRAQQTGANLDALRPQLELLRQIERAQVLASGSLDKIGLSAKQTTQALRQVPAQFTDIIVSLQAGQPPLQVLLQQGGQLKDVFHGVGAAAQALGKYILGLVNPYTIAAAAAAALVVAYNLGSKEADAYNKALILTGNAAGTTVGQLQAYAQQISGVVGTQGKAAEALAAFAASGAVGSENLKSFAESAIRFERATGTAIDETVKKFARLRESPLQASIELNKSTGFLTEALYQQIRALEGQGRATEAAVVAQKAFNDVQIDRSADILKNLGSFERGWLAIKDAIKGAADAVLNVGRPTSEASKLPGIQTDIASRERLLAFGRPQNRNRSEPLDGRERSRATVELKNLRAQEAAIIARESKAQAVADTERRRVESVRASQAFDKSGERFQSPRDKLNKDLAESVNEGVAAGRSQEAILSRIAAIHEDFAKKNKVSTTEENKALKDQTAVYSALAGVSSTYYADLANAQKQRAAGLITEGQYVELVNQLIVKQPFAVALEKERTEAVKQRQKAEEEALKIDNDALEIRQRSADSVREHVLRLKDEEEASIIAARRNISLAEAIGEVELARLQDERAQQAGLGASDATLLAIDQEIAARRELIRLVASKEAREVNQKAAKDAAQEWQKTADSISSSLTDALLRGFESGKGFLRNLVDTAKNLFQTLVLRPQIQAVFGIGGAGASGGALAGNGGGGGGFDPSSITSLFGGNSIGTGIGSGLVSTGNFLVSAGFDKFGAAVSSFADSAAGFSNLAYGGAGLAGGLIGKLVFGGKGLSGIGGSLGGIGGLALSGAGGAAAGTAIGATLGSALPVVGTILGALVGSFIGSLFGGGKPYNSGGAFQAKANGAGFRPTDRATLKASISTLGRAGFEDFSKRGSPALDDSTKTLATGLQTTLVDILGSFGKTADDVFVAFRANGKKATGNVNIGGVQTVLQTSEKDPKKAFTEFADFAARSTLSALEKANLPQFAKDLLTEVSKAPGVEALQTVAQTIQQIIEATKALRLLPFDNLKNISEQSVVELAKLTGGLKNLGTATAAYYAAFFSAEEQRAEAQRQIAAEFAKLGIAVPGSNAAFRALVTAQDLSTDAGRKLYAQLLTLSPAFASLTAATDQFRESVRGVTNGLVDEAARIRGTSGTQTLSGAQAAFAIATASARAGSQDAAKTLPGLSQTLLDLAEKNATSSQALASIRAQTANSLDATASALSAALGVPFTGAVVSANTQPLTQNSRSTTDDTLAALKAMQAELAAMRAAAELTATNTRQTSDTLRRVTQDGDALVTTPL